MPQNAFFSTNSRSSGQTKNVTTQRHFFPTLHPLSTVIFATATVLAFVLLHDSRLNFHCYTQREATPTQKSARPEVRCDLSRLLARKITKRIYSSKPASPNPPISTNYSRNPQQKVSFFIYFCLWLFRVELASWIANGERSRRSAAR